MPRHQLGEQYTDFAQQDDTLQFGMWVFLASESLLFAALFALYGAYRTMYRADFEEAIRHNTIVYGTVNMMVLLTSSFTVAMALWAVRR
ncbi:MAG: cytochrome c oxidase subunit 3 family protein, partial [Myxococcales bacterium]|nr:cytochrome c oxidase subunit 3 family protein [Myxococcales bacterium]